LEANTRSLLIKSAGDIKNQYCKKQS